ncbi:AMP-binding protein [Alteribacillus sp. HJP-4]|uniref:AMP-binding protein n=1 Tax=Alteribacillus sp. HJP-4 TaxID=2775394 RepID=UPI0035CD23F8
MNICERVFDHAVKQPDSIAVSLDKSKITYHELAKKISQVSNLLRNNKHAARTSVALLMGNEVETLEIFLGAAHAGWTAAPLDTKWSQRELLSIIDHVRPDVIFVHVKYLHQLRELTYCPEIIVCGSGAADLSPNLKYKEQLDSQPFLQVKPAANPHAPFYLGFTSGTTGMPKGFLRSHLSWVESFRVWNEEMNWSPEDAFYVPGPLVHSLFLFAALHAVHTGAQCILERTFHADKSIQNIKTKKISAFYAVPTMLEAIRRVNPDLHDICLQKIISSGAKTDTGTEQWWTKAAPETEWIEFYGASELSFVSLLRKQNKTGEASLGIPFSNVDTFVQREDGTEAAPGDIGELFVRSPMVFSGYFGEAAEAEEWLSAGDLVRQDERGFLYLAGRKKNMIVSGGLNVYPEEVEHMLKTHEAVSEAIVFGRRDEYWGEAVSAVVTSEIPEEKLIPELEAFCRKKLSLYKCPKQWHVLEQIPLTTSGKPARTKVIESLN